MSNSNAPMQLVKEFRPVLVPWIVAVAAGGMIAIKPLEEGAAFEGLLMMVVWYGFLGGLALVATLVFGQELHDRTLPLLLVQPISRSRVWRQKMLVASGAIVAAVIAEIGLLAGISSWYSGSEVWDAVHSFGHAQFFLAGMFLVATVCSCGFWTLEAGSIVGGIVFTVASQLLTSLAVVLVWERIGDHSNPSDHPLNFIAVAAMGLMYSGIFLFLSWRKFVRLELKSAVPGAAATGSSRFIKLPGRGVLAPGPHSPALNLIRKELRLQKPIAQLAIAFAVFWCGVVLLQLLRPPQNITYLFDMITFLFGPVSALLAGCISLGEERALNLNLSQMALPFSARIQWLLKLLVSAGTAAVLSLALPMLLFRLTWFIINLHGCDLMNPTGDAIVALAIISGLMFLLGFWASTLSPNTVRAALVAIVGIIALPALSLLGIYWGSHILGAAANGPRSNQVQAALWITGACAFIVMLIQSILQFRRSEERKSRLFSYALVLAALVLFTAFWATCVV